MEEGRRYLLCAIWWRFCRCFPRDLLMAYWYCIHYLWFCSLFAFSFSVPGGVGWCLTGAGSAGGLLDWDWLGGLDGRGGHGGSLGGVAVFGGCVGVVAVIVVETVVLVAWLLVVS